MRHLRPLAEYGDVDFENVRRERGAVVNVSGTINPTTHLVIDLRANTQWLHPREQSLVIGRRVFTARVWRAKATYTFTARSFIRVVSQYVAGFSADRSSCA